MDGWFGKRVTWALAGTRWHPAHDATGSVWNEAALHYTQAGGTGSRPEIVLDRTSPVVVTSGDHTGAAHQRWASATRGGLTTAVGRWS
jgi:hypothetical protein